MTGRSVIDILLQWRKLQLQDKRLKNPLTCFRHFLANSQKFTSHPSNNFKENHFPMQTPTHSFCGWRSKGKLNLRHPPWNNQPNQPNPSIRGHRGQPARGRSNDPNPTLPTTVGLQIQVPWSFLSVDDVWCGIWKKKKNIQNPKPVGCFGWISWCKVFWKTKPVWKTMIWKVRMTHPKPVKPMKYQIAGCHSEFLFVELQWCLRN